jgi:hypothetical protein
MLFGYAVLVAIAIIAWAAAWLYALTQIGRRCMESKEFFALVAEYARRKKARGKGTDVMGIEE